VPVTVGTSGWHYPHWRGGFYPRTLPPREWLRHYAERFATVEINNAFYRLPEVTAVAGWAAAVPDDFVVTVKASRYLTHVRRLRDPEEPVARFRQRMAGLGSKFGPVLLQLPPNLRIDTDALASTLAAFSGLKVAVEFRHPSWYVPETQQALADAGAALCITDTAGRRTPLWRTSTWGYVRFHAGRARPSSCYGRAALDS
jgi:uncharacterized protein YecE (DUF72 family)